MITEELKIKGTFFLKSKLNKGQSAEECDATMLIDAV